MKNLVFDKKMVYYVFGRNGSVASGVHIIGEKKLDIKPISEQDFEVNTSVLVLEEVNRILGLIKETIDNGAVYDNPIKIRINDSLLRTIQNGTFKYWIRTGKYMDGNSVNERELEQWKIFTKLYGSLFGDVVLNTHRISKKYINKDNVEESAAIKYVWDMLPEEVVIKGINKEENSLDFLF